jgi:hypothetical protein
MTAYFEHNIKELYRELIGNILKNISHDDLEFYRKYAVSVL